MATPHSESEGGAGTSSSNILFRPNLDWIANALWILVVSMLLATLVANLHPWFELATHFSFHFLWISGVAVVLSLVHRMVRWIGGSRSNASGALSRSAPNTLRGFTHLLAFVVFSWIVAPWEWVAKKESFTESQGTRVLSWNVWLKNYDSASVVSIIREQNADIVALFEVNPELAAGMEVLRGDYLEKEWTPEWDPGSCVVLSKIPGTSFKRVNLAEVGMRAVEIDFPAWNGKRAGKLLAIHTKSPTPFHPSRTRARDRQLEATADWVRQQNGRAAVLGDLNITPYSPTFRRLMNEGGLQDSRTGFGNQASWPAFLQAFGIPIDHVLVNSHFQVKARKVIRPNPCSDHSPVLVELL